MADQRIVSVDITHLVTAALAGEARNIPAPLLRPTGTEQPRRFAALPELSPLRTRKE